MNLFVVDTPLQLLNAIEGREAFDAHECTLVILLWPHWRKRYFEDILRERPFPNIKYFPMPALDRVRRSSGPLQKWSSRVREVLATFKQFIFKRRFERLLQTSSPIHRLFIGNYRNDYMKHVTNVVAHQELVFLDDGTDALQVAELRLASNSCAREPDRGVIGGLREHLRNRYIEWDTTPADRATFFTSYSFPVSATDSVVQNDYGDLKKRLTAIERTGEILFLGQPLVADGYISSRTFSVLLGEIREYFAGRSLVYVPHPREEESDFSAEAVAQGYRIQRFEAPIEVALCSSARLPATICSFFCSALETCACLFQPDLEILAFEIAEDDLLHGRTEAHKAYEHFRTARAESVHVVALRGSDAIPGTPQRPVTKETE